MAKQVSIDFLTRLKDKGLKDLKKQTGANEKALKGLQNQIKRTFSVLVIGAFVRSTTRAFLEEDKAIRRLNTSLKNVGQGFRSLAVEDFISKTQLSSRVLDSELRPAMAQLINAGIEFEKSQKILNTALDISAGTGKDLQSVVTALSRAYLGNTTGLSRLQAGLSKTELKTLDFDQIVEKLSVRFSGQAAAAADSYSGKLAGITIAVDEAQEAIGKDLIQALEKLAEGDFDKVLQAIAAGANAIGAAINSVAFSVAFLREFLKTGLQIDPVEQARLDALKESFFGDNQPNQKTANRQFLNEYRKQLAIQKQVEAERLKTQKASLKTQKASAAQTKRTAEIERLRSSIQFKFDIDAINLQAALRRKLSIEDRDRVLQLSALKISDYQSDEEAIKTLQAATSGRYTEALNNEKVLQLLKMAGYASDKAAIDALAALKPEIKFEDNLDSIIAKLKALIEGKYTISIGATITVPNIPTPGGTASSGGLPPTFNPGGFRKKDEDGTTDGSLKPPFGKPPGINLPGEVGGEPATAFPRPFVPDTGSFRFFEENQSSYLRNLYDNTSVPSNFDPSSFRFFEETGFTARGMETPSFFDPARFRARDEGVVVNVNVQGSVVAQNDLVAAVTDAVYATQRSGNNLLLAE